jgi:hypothetical protein
VPPAPPPPASSYCTCIYPADDTELYISYLYSKRENGKKVFCRKKIFSFLFFLRLFGSEGYLSDGHYADDRCTGGSDAQVFTNFAFTHTHKRRKKKKGRCEIRSIHPPDDFFRCEKRGRRFENQMKINSFGFIQLEKEKSIKMNKRNLDRHIKSFQLSIVFCWPVYLPGTTTSNEGQPKKKIK